MSPAELKRNFAGATELWSKNEKNFSHFDFTPQMRPNSISFRVTLRKAKRIYGRIPSKIHWAEAIYGAISYQSALGFLELKTERKEAGQNI